ncbi:hypothetical protein [Desulfofustis glycolicus]|uniref:FlgN protein n=1 Tax=Desulfofustis glycolicus DSM 9705 TaxID=1121409 RepID=A0A1M5TZL7_9BACT|nr:hypothetical protein [Desulfofustis glycolicus]MCB2214741.1 hypothetical protein [Desulfobulbaceae bacterium]SHH56199.1 hypothetical protein SAMN02745124_00917 [Desulfofustis glycolicus DSM 9705]
MEDCKHLVEKSIECYKAMLLHAQEFSLAISDRTIAADDFLKHNDRLKALQQEIETADAELMTTLNNKADLFALDGLLEMRSSMIKELQDHNDSMLARLSSMMEMTRIELDMLRKGMHSLAGYHSKTIESTGSIIRSSY